MPKLELKADLIKAHQYELVMRRSNVVFDHSQGPEWTPGMHRLEDGSQIYVTETEIYYLDESGLRRDSAKSSDGGHDLPFMLP